MKKSPEPPRWQPIARGAAVVALASATILGLGAFRGRAQEAQDRKNLRVQRDAGKIVTPEMILATIVDAQAKELGLGETQTKAYMEKAKALFASIASLAKDKSLKEDEKKLKFVLAWVKGQEEIKSLLTPEQRTRFDAMAAEGIQKVQAAGQRLGGQPQGSAK